MGCIRSGRKYQDLIKTGGEGVNGTKKKIFRGKVQVCETDGKESQSRCNREGKKKSKSGKCAGFMEKKRQQGEIGEKKYTFCLVG